MEKKRALMVNVLAIAVILLLIAAAMLFTKLTPRQITPNAGVLEGFEPAQTTEAPAVEPSSRMINEIQGDRKEVLFV